MARFVLLVLILSHTFLTLSARCSRIEPTVVQAPAFSPSNDRSIQTVEAPRSRKLGKHHVSALESPTTGPSSHDHEENTAEEDGMYLEKHHHSHGSSSADKSIAGGGVILGGLVMAFVVSIVCYIRATRRRSMVEPPTPTTVRSSASP
ncbi:hypothetical protein SSX86_004234 [Deinandra increscens subsp. villosa]|uniref:Transmembrane protein n=1 Tax=Deinandra increscens subsp. villosa TaxID=3103831 RepID=A0AAP0DJ71_9ASTR